MNVWKDRWLPRETTFKVYTPEIDAFKYMKVGELIKKEDAEWRKDLIESLFTHGDADTILEILLHTSWPQDTLVWHYDSKGLFSIWSAYHLIRNCASTAVGSVGSSNGQSKEWHFIWVLNLPP